MIGFLYFKLYKYSVRFSDKDEHPQWFAASLLSGIFSLNAITFLDLLHLLNLHLFVPTTFSFVLVAVSMFAFIYYRILYQNKYLQIVANFTEKNKTKKIFFNVLFGFYLVASIFLMMYIINLKNDAGL